jgi:uncharacterized protein YjiS (DUF1127 family)
MFLPVEALEWLPEPFAPREVKHERNAPMLGDIMNRYRRWRTYQTTVSELARLSNRELDDLGISRADIPFVAAKSAR